MTDERSRLRQLQDHMLNSSWRIKLIPFDDPNKTMRVKGNPLSLLGGLGFVGVMGYILYAGSNPDIEIGPEKGKLLIIIGVSCFLVALLSMFLQGRMKRRKWVKCYAKCVDKEINEMMGGQTGIRVSSKKVHVIRLLCEFKYRSESYQVTPGYWKSFSSQENAEAFFEKTIRGDGLCQLWVNPQNPLETEFIGKDVKDFLLH